MKILKSITVLATIINPFFTSATLLSTVLTPHDRTIPEVHYRQGRSRYADERYGDRGLIDRLSQYDHQSQKCARCDDDRYPDEGRTRERERYDESDRSQKHRPTFGNRLDRTKGYGDDDHKNDTSEEDTGNKWRRPNDNRYDDRQYDDRRYDDRRYDDRDRYPYESRRPEYYDRQPARDPYYRDPYEREDPYRRPVYNRHDDDGYGASRYNYGNRRRPHDDDYERGNGYDDLGYGRGRYPHDSFRPWDESYRGTSGFDEGGRGYYFASGRPDYGSTSGWGRPEYARPEEVSGWQNLERDYLRPDPAQRPEPGYRPDPGYRPSAWHSVDRRPASGGWRDQSYMGGGGRGPYGHNFGPSAYGLGVGQVTGYGQRGQSDGHAQSGQGYGQSGQGYGQSGQGYGQSGQGYGQSGQGYGQSGQGYGQNGQGYGQSGQGYGQNGQRYDQNGPNYGQNSQSSSTSGYGQTSSTTPGTSYLFQREHDNQSPKAEQDENTTKSS